MTTHKGHFRWFNDELVYGKQQWTRVYFVLHMEERALCIYKEKKDQAKEWKKIDVSKGSCVNGRQKGKKHVFVFTANNTKEYVFRSEHKNKKKQWVRYLNDAAKAAPKEEPKPAPAAAAAEKKPEEAPKKEEEEASSSDESSSSDSDSSSSDEEDEAAAAAAAKKKAEEEAAAAAAAKKKADEEAAAAAAEAERKKKEADEAAAAAAAAKKKADEEEAERKKKEAEKEEESSSSDDDSSSSGSSSSDESESEAPEAPAPAAAAPQPAAADVPKNAEVHNTYPRLLQLQGKKKTEITITHVPATGASVNDSDVFILDCDKTVYTWLGASPNMWQKQAAATLTRAMDDERGSSVNNLVISNATSSDAAKFWELLGGKPEQLSKSAPEAQLPVLFQLSDASGKMEFAEVGRGNPLKRSLLDSNDVFIADLGFHIFCWIGKKASRDERDKAVGYALDYKQKYNRPAHIHVERVMDGGENEILYSFFQ